MAEEAGGMIGGGGGRRTRRGIRTKYCNGRRGGWRTKIARDKGLLRGLDRQDDCEEWEEALKSAEVDEAHPHIEPGEAKLRTVSQYQELYCGRTAGWGTYHTGVGRCRRHGGTTPVGPANPAWKDGSRSKTNSLLEQIESVDFGREIGDLERPIKSADFRLLELYRKLEMIADTPELRLAVESAVERMPSMLEGVSKWRYDADLFYQHMNGLLGVVEELDQALEHATDSTELWEKIQKLEEHKRKLSATKAKNESQGRNVIRRELVEALGAQWLGMTSSLFEEYLSDPDERREALARLTGGMSRFMPGIAAGDPVPQHRLVEAEGRGADSQNTA